MSDQLTKNQFLFKKAIPNSKFVFIVETFDIDKYFNYKTSKKQLIIKM